MLICFPLKDRIQRKFEIRKLSLCFSCCINLKVNSQLFQKKARMEYILKCRGSQQTDRFVHYLSTDKGIFILLRFLYVDIISLTFCRRKSDVCHKAGFRAYWSSLIFQIPFYGSLKGQSMKNLQGSCDILIQKETFEQRNAATDYIYNFFQVLLFYLMSTHHG